MLLAHPNCTVLRPRSRGQDGLLPIFVDVDRIPAYFPPPLLTFVKGDGFLHQVSVAEGSPLPTLGSDRVVSLGSFYEFKLFNARFAAAVTFRSFGSFTLGHRLRASLTSLSNSWNTVAWDLGLL